MFISFLFLLLSQTAALAQPPYLVHGMTVPNSRGDAVADGDTLRVQPDNWDGSTRSVMKIRMIGMDTPELHLPVSGGGPVGQTPWGQEASDYLESLVPAYTPITVEVHGTDRYGRVLGRLYVGEQNADVNYLMVRSGWAMPYVYCQGAECAGNYFEQEQVGTYLQACEEARAEGRGVYNPSNPMTEEPFEFRLRMQKRRPDKYVGDFVTRRLYNPTDYSAVDTCRRVFFADINQAMALGFQF